MKLLSTKFRRFLPIILTIPLKLGCGAAKQSASDIKQDGGLGGGGFRLTGRTSMGPQDRFQCYSLGSYTGSEKVRGRWIAGVDGATLGTLYDASSGTQGSGCGRIFRINHGGKCEDFIVADRIWENDGSGGRTYKVKADADRKGPGTGQGYPQVDIAVAAFQSLYGGNNPSGSVNLEWNQSCDAGGGGMKPSPKSGMPPDFSPNFPTNFPDNFPPNGRPNFPDNFPPNGRPHLPSSPGQSRPPVWPPIGRPGQPDWPADFPDYGPSDTFGSPFDPQAFRNRPSPMNRRPLPRPPYDPYNRYDRSNEPMMSPRFSNYRAP